LCQPFSISDHEHDAAASSRRFDPLVRCRDLFERELLAISNPPHPAASASFTASAALALFAGAKSSLPRKSTRTFLKSSGQNGMPGVATSVAEVAIDP